MILGDNFARRDVGTYSFVNRTIKRWNQLPAGLLAPFPCKINTFRKRDKNVVTNTGIQGGGGGGGGGEKKKKRKEAIM